MSFPARKQPHYIVIAYTGGKTGGFDSVWIDALM
jgi:hypothetical protein